MKAVARLASVLLAVGICCWYLLSASALDRETRREVLAAVVQISLVKVSEGDAYYLPWGSGTLISPDGLILTNSHVADPLNFGYPAGQVPDYDYLGIGLTISSDQPPRLVYLAEVVKADASLDLAVVRITRRLDGSPIQSESLSLPFVEIGDSDSVEVGDDLTVFGYPGIGGETVTLTRGIISGFALDAGISGRAWMKTDASISGGNSGGTAVDGEGRLVAVPTRAGLGGGTAPVDCRAVRDTNNDGSVDGEDDCVSIGGFINALRPVALARSLIESSRLGLTTAELQETQPEEASGTSSSGPSFAPIRFAGGIDSDGHPLETKIDFATGLGELHAFSDYAGMRKGLSVGAIWYLNGEQVAETSQEWGAGESGTWRTYITSETGDLPDGEYQLNLEGDGKVMQSAIARVGAAQATPQATPVPSGGIHVEGWVHDLDTGRPIAAATFLLLAPGVSAEDFTWKASEVHTWSETDREGWFQLEFPLERGRCYSAIVLAQDYWPYRESDLCVTDTLPATVEVRVLLERK